MKKFQGSHWGWGFHIDLNGNLRDVFPLPELRKEKEAPAKNSPQWHVKKRLKKPAMATR